MHLNTETIEMPFGKGHLEVRIPTKNLKRIYALQEPPGLADEEKALAAALAHPIESKRLSALIGPQERVCILVSDITRPVPSKRIVTAILRELGSTPRNNITIVVATGLHRKNTDDELRALLGRGITGEIEVINHDAFAERGLRYAGKTSRGTELYVNVAVSDADKVIATGYIEPHEFAGFTGGRKSILPGICGADSINYNHRLENLDHPRAKTGILDGNPIHEDMVEAARIIGVDFIVNVVLNSKKQIVAVAAGDLERAHEKGVEFCRKHAQVALGESADIVITSSGYPLDINLYQAVKSIFAAEPFARKGGTIILLAECEKGFGTDLFYRWMTSFTSPTQMIHRIKEEGYRADIDHCYFLARILGDKEITIVSPHKHLQEINGSLMKTTDSAEEAIHDALKIRGENSGIALLPYAQRFLPKSTSA